MGLGARGRAVSLAPCGIGGTGEGAWGAVAQAGQDREIEEVRPKQAARPAAKTMGESPGSFHDGEDFRTGVCWTALGSSTSQGHNLIVDDAYC